MKKQKLIAQYQEKIKTCDDNLMVIKEKKRAMRANHCESDYDDICNESRIVSAQRQCYVQFISDLEYELE